MNSSLHYWWVIQYGVTLRTDATYTPTTCFEPYPLPLLNQVETGMAGSEYEKLRRQIMLARQEGLTKTYNRFHDRRETAADIVKLQRLHVEMDQTVAAAYGWTDIDLGHDFHQTKQGLRYTISEPAQREVLARLLRLNHERYAEEVRQGLHEKKKTTAAKKPRKATANTDEGDSLFE